MATKKSPPRQSRQPADPVAGLVSLLDLEQLDLNLFRGLSPAGGWGRVYGGQVLAQSIIAAARTVEPVRLLHSMHAYFLLAGDPAHPIVYEVERLREGGSFTTRRVTAIQAGQPIFSMIGSFHKDERGFDHSSPMPVVPPPELVPTLAELFARPEANVPATMRAYYAQDRPIEIRLVEAERYLGGGPSEPRQHLWLKVRRPLGGDHALHSAVLAFASDFVLLDTALIPHGKLMFDAAIQLASLDHVLWLHAPFRADEWLLYVLDSPVAGRGRGFTRGAFYDRSGALVASVAQEGLIRSRSTAFVIK